MSSNKSSDNLALPDDPSRLSAGRKSLFWMAAILLPFLLIAGAELILASLSGNDTTPPIFLPVDQHPEYVVANPAYFSRYFGGNFSPELANTPFMARKRGETFRVVAIGGSTTVGYPYSDYLGFPAQLKRRLEERLPDTHVEVINLGATACNSFTFLDIIDEIVALKPDAIISYLGHNEYYGAYGAGNAMRTTLNHGWVKRLAISLKRFHVYRAVESLLSPQINEELGATMMERVVGDADILLDGRVYELGISEFASNMHRLLARIHEQEIPVFAATLVSNLKDQRPLGDLVEADSVFELAGRHWADGDTIGAAQLYTQAKDLDPIRFRAPTGMNTAIRRLDVTAVVDMEKIAETYSMSGIPDSSFFSDHLHPTVAGYVRMGDAFFEVLDDHFSEQWPAEIRNEPIPVYSETSSALDQILADLQIYGLKMGYPFRKDISPSEQMALLEAKLHYLGSSEDNYERIGQAVMTGRLSKPEAMGEGFRVSLAKGDTTQVLLHLESLLYLLPFDIEQLQQAGLVSKTLEDSGEFGVLARRIGRHVHNAQLGFSAE